MSVRVRQSMATPGSSEARPAGSAATLPEYQPPTFALNPDAQRSIANLLRKHNVKRLEESISHVQEEITTTGVDLHDKLYEHEAACTRRQGRQSQATQAEQFAAFEQQVREMRQKVENMTNRMEKEMRALIDCSASVKAMQDAVTSAEADAKANASTQASTQHTQRQPRINRDAGSDDEEDEEDDDQPRWEPTDPAGGTQHAPKDVFDKHVQQARHRFQGMSLYERYAENEAYVNFKQFLHDAQHPDAEQTREHLPDASQWFAEAGAPPPGTHRNVNQADDSDDDIAIVRGQISTRCPLTLQEFREPLTSKKCRHTYEAHAILSMIAESTMRPKAAQCPVPGCSAVLEKGDVHADKLFIRKIQRVQKAKRLQEQRGDDSGSDMDRGTQRRGHVIDDDDDDDGDGEDDGDNGHRNAKPQIKPESRITGLTSQPQPSQAPHSTQVVDLGESDEDEEMEDSEIASLL